MFERPKTILQAATLWVACKFDAIQQDIIACLMKYEPDKWREVTVPVVGDTVFVHRADICGEIIEHDEKSGDYRIRLSTGSEIYARLKEFKVCYDSDLPIWLTMWSFSDGFDDRWLKEWGGLEAMSQCGFRIYEHDDFGYFFGIDGAGYDFYEEHWIPLYKARGMEWHVTD